MVKLISKIYYRLPDILINKLSIKKLSGSAMILTMFILSGMLIIAMSGSYMVLLGIMSSGTQAQSTRAYFAAEAGVEHLLYEVRINSFKPNANTGISILDGTLDPLSFSNYEVFYIYNAPDKFYTSVGERQSTKRSVEVRF